MIRKTIIVSFVILLTSSIFGFFAANESDVAFDPQIPGGIITPSLPKAADGSISYLIIKGAGFFLKSNSDLLLILNIIEKSEISGLDYLELQKALDSAINHLDKARQAYFQLKSLAAVTPYNQEVIDKLMVFDFDEFQRRKGLNAVIFGKVKIFLSVGDVRGAYNRYYEDVLSLLEQIKSFESTGEVASIPAISQLWRINQKYSEMLLFGQYLSEVFYELR